MEVILALRGAFLLAFSTVPHDFTDDVCPVYAMYNEARWIGVLLVVLFVAEEVIMAVSLARTIPGITFNYACVSLGVPRDVVFFGCGSPHPYICARLSRSWIALHPYSTSLFSLL